MMTPDDILRLRQAHLGPSLSLSYDQPLHIVSGQGAYLFDASDHRYLDCVNNVCHVGHGHPKVVEAGAKQMEALNTNTRYLHENLARYSERLCSLFPDPLNVCFLVCSGSEANDLALRLARNATGGTDHVVLQGGYHGNLSSLIDISSYKFDGPGGSGPPPHVQCVPMPDPYRGRHRAGKPKLGQRYARYVGEALEAIQQAERLPASFIAESILSCGGQIVLPDGYLEEAYRHTRQHQALCQADEVQVGFGRVGSHWWGFETQRVVPDIVTLGKPIGNGHPMAAVVTTQAIAEQFANGMEYFNTFGGNPVSCAIGLAVLDVIEEENLRDNAARVGSHLKSGLTSLAGVHDILGDVRGLGLFLGIELVTDRSTRQPAPQAAHQLVNLMKDEGILLSTDGPDHNVIKIKPPLVFSKSDADFLLTTLDKVLKQIEPGTK